MANYFDAMVCTVGENPLPVYLGIAQLTKPDAKIVLLHSEETEDEAKRIRTCLGSGRTILLGKDNDCLIKNPWDFQAVFKTISYWADELPNAAINITGGTNVMTGVGMTAWVSRKNYSVVYLEERGNQFRIGDGRTVPLTEKISFDLLRQLHGVEKVHVSSKLPENADAAAACLYKLFQSEELEGIYRAEQKDIYDDFRNPNYSPLLNWLKNEGGNQIWEEVRNKIPAWRDNPTLPQTWQDFVSDPSTGELHETGKRIQFAAGLWMEHLVYKALSEAVPEATVVMNQEFTIKKQKFEIDVLAVVNNRFYAVSITSQSYHKIIKSKAFEVMHRARQIGGGLAHSVVVSMINSNSVKYCQLSVDPSENPRHKIMPAANTKRVGRYPDFKFPPITLEEWNQNLVREFVDYFKKQA